MSIQVYDSMLNSRVSLALRPCLVQLHLNVIFGKGMPTAMLFITSCLSGLNICISTYCSKVDGRPTCDPAHSFIKLSVYTMVWCLSSEQHLLWRCSTQILTFQSFFLLTSCCSGSVVRCFEGWWSGIPLQTSSNCRSPAGSSTGGGFRYWDLMASGTWVQGVRE